MIEAGQIAEQRRRGKAHHLPMEACLKKTNDLPNCSLVQHPPSVILRPH